MKGFYAGSIPNLGRVMIKNVYRYPLMIGLPSFYEKHLPNRIRQNKPVQKFFTGASIAVIESFILCPFERLKTYMMTANAHENGFGNYVKSSTNLIPDLFRGIGSLILRQMVAWTFFLQADLFMKQKIRKIWGIKENENISSKYLIPASFGVAVVSTVIIMPFDSLKTH